MSDEQQKSTPKRKIITAVALTLVLVVLPAISWLYLRDGLQWRKDAKAELGSYGKIRGAFIIYPDGTKENQLAESVCVIHNFGANPELTEGNKQIIETNKRLYDQFGKMSNGMPRPFFKIVIPPVFAFVTFSAYLFVAAFYFITCTYTGAKTKAPPPVGCRVYIKHKRHGNIAHI